MLPSPSTSEAELVAMRRRAWRQQGVAVLAMQDIDDPWLREVVFNEAKRLYGDTAVRSR
jgi:hypothetical protein